MKRMSRCWPLLVLLLAACGSASQSANQRADQALYQPVSYTNAATQGPLLVVLPGSIKSNNASFSQKITPTNIADYAELELGRANFRILERTDLGPMLDEVKLAVSLGDPEALSKFRKGRFKSTRWFARFDILKAEPVASGSSGFSAGFLGSVAGSLLGGTEGSIAESAGESISVKETAGVWIIGMRYKLLDASSSEQVATGYFEKKMEIGKKAGSFLGFSKGQEQLVTLDSMVQRLVQESVAEIDAQHK